MEQGAGPRGREATAGGGRHEGGGGGGRRARGERERDDAMREGWRLGAHFNNPPKHKGGEGARALEVPCDHK